MFKRRTEDCAVIINKTSSLELNSEQEMLIILLVVISNIVYAIQPRFKEDNKLVYEATDGEPFKTQVSRPICEIKDFF